MKKISLLQISFLILLVVAGSSCKKWIDKDINQDPNKPTDVTMNLLLPSAEAELCYQAGGDLAYAARLWTQQIAGGGTQMLAWDRYIYTQSDVDNVWKFGMYSVPMMDLHTIIQKAGETNSPHFGGVAKILMADALGRMTDVFGSIPYSQAFQGDGNLQPAYDTQEQIYNTIGTLLDEGIGDCSAEVSSFSPGSEDMFFEGDLSKWIRTAWTLKARYALHLSKVKGNSVYTDVLNALAGGMADNTDDLELAFGTNFSEQNPIYEFLDQRPGDAVMAKFMVDTLFTAGDPRATLFCDTTGVGAVGSAPGAGETACTLGPYYASPASPVVLCSFVETKFIEAEAKLQTGDADGAATAYNDAIKASLAKFGVSDAAWEAIYANETGNSITLKKIITQKYIALFLQQEVYNDWRRTGYPELLPFGGGNIPRRYPYPSSELNYNGAHVPPATLYDRVWWDVAKK